MMPTFSLNCFPCIEWLARAEKAGEICIEAQENFQKQSFRNRFEILSSSGKFSCVLPAHRPSGEKIKFTQIEFEHNINWGKDAMGAIEAAYSSSPYYLYYFEEVFDLIKHPPKKIFDFNLAALSILKKGLSLDFNHEFTKKWVPDIEHDFRGISHKKHKSTLNFPEYAQVFSDKLSFVSNLSGLDLLFNLGPEGKLYIHELIEN